jgi:hypothetical protein
MRHQAMMCSGMLGWLCIVSTAVGQFNRQAPKYSPTIDGAISAAEMAGQLDLPMAWPMAEGFLAFEGAGSGPDDLSATWYVSWDDANFYVSAIVRDNTPDYRIDSLGGNVPYNAQDLIQPTFNPFNDPDNFFAPDPGGGPAAIYDMVVNAADDFGPDIYRHGATLPQDEYEMIAIAGSENPDEDGYVLEASIPWQVAMDNVESDYVPTVGDTHGLSFILISFNGEQGATDQIATLFTDFGQGANTIGDPTTWNSVTLIGPHAASGDFNGDGQFDAADIDDLTAQSAGQTNPSSYDLTGDGRVDSGDVNVWVRDIYWSWIGDANLDGQFNSSDLVRVLASGTYEADVNSVWSSGDFNGDGRTNSSDLVVALSDGGYEQGPRTPVAAVPEPTVMGQMLLATALWIRRQAKRPSIG